MMILLLVILLPVSVWVLSAWAELFDHGDKNEVLKRVVIRTGIVAVVVIALGTEAAWAALIAAVSVGALHLGWFYASRWLMRRGRFNAPEFD